jgi:hypothetical protein
LDPYLNLKVEGNKHTSTLIMFVQKNKTLLIFGKISPLQIMGVRGFPSN